MRLPKWRTYEQFLNQTQLSGQGAETYIDHMSAKAKQMDIDKDSTLTTTLRGLHKELQPIVLMKGPTSQEGCTGS